MTYLPADIDPGEPSFDIAYDPQDTATYTVLTGLQGSGALAAFQLTTTPPGGSAQTKAFSAYVASLGREFQKRELNVCKVGLRISGNPGM